MTAEQLSHCMGKVNVSIIFGRSRYSMDATMSITGLAMWVNLILSTLGRRSETESNDLAKHALNVVTL